MIPPEASVVLDAMRQFLKGHATCGGTALDTPDLPGRPGYRAVIACRCGDTVEYWLGDGPPARQHLADVLMKRQVA